MVFAHDDIVGGVDTHKHTHTAAAIDGLGRVLAIASYPATNAGMAELISWLRSHGNLAAVGVEGTGAWGKNLSRALAVNGVAVHEVHRANRQHRRRHGKSDPADAIAAAKAVLSNDADGLPKAATGDAEAIRSLRLVRSSAMKSRTSCTNQIHAVIATAPSELCDELTGLTIARIIKAAATYPNTTPDSPLHAARWALHTLARRHQHLSDEIRHTDEHLATLVQHAAPPALLAEHGIGIEIAGIIISALGDNPERCHTEAALAALAGTSPVDASTGKQTRHRLNRGGNRELNHALWRIVMVRLRWHQPTKDYIARRTTEGLTKKEIIRCLKRYIARDIWKIYRDHLAAQKTCLATP